LGYWSHDNGTVRVSHQGLALHSADVHDSLSVSNWTCLVGTGKLLSRRFNRFVVSINITYGTVDIKKLCELKYETDTRLLQIIKGMKIIFSL
jgi:hypothetical protein